LLEHTQKTAIQDEDEISLVDIIRFFSRNGKFLLLTTLGLSAIAIILALLQPKQYQKQLTVSVKPVPFFLSTSLNPNLSVDLDINQAGSFALTLLQNQPLNQITATSKYTTATRNNIPSQQIDLTLKSSNPAALKAAGPKILNQLKVGLQKTVESTVQANRIRIEQELKRFKQLLAEMEKQIAQTPKDTSAIVPNPRLQALEQQRSRYIESITSLEFDKQNLLQAQKNPAEFASRVILVQILAESPVRPGRSPVMVALLAVIASFMVAVLAAIIRDQVLRLQGETSKPEITSSKKV
jgi:hypothetical protein